MKANKLFQVVILMICGLAASTQALAEYKLQIKDNSGNGSLFTVDDQLQLNVENNALQVFSPKVNCYILIDNIKSINYISPSIVDKFETDSLFPQIMVTDFRITLEMSDNIDNKDIEYEIFDLGGHLIRQGEFQKYVDIPLDSFSKGIYVLNVNNFPSIKFIVR